jgi:hypothetical protein
LIAIFALGIPRSDSEAQTISGTYLLVQKLRDILADVHPQSVKSYFVTAFAFGAYGGLAVDEVKLRAQTATSDGEVRNLAGHIEAVYEASEEAKTAVEQINVELPEMPDYSHIGKQASTAFEGQCNEGAALQDKISRIDKAIAELEEIKNLSQAYLRVMPGLEQLAKILHDYWRDVFLLAQAHDVYEEWISYGTMTDQWYYWTAPGGWKGCDWVNKCAPWFLSEGHQKWQAVERRSDVKIATLKRHRETYDAMYQFAYASGAERCASGEPLTVKSLEQELDALVSEQVEHLDSRLAAVNDQFEARWHEISQHLVTAFEGEKDASRRAFLMDLSRTAGLFLSERDARGLECMSSLVADSSASNAACMVVMQHALNRSNGGSGKSAAGRGDDDPGIGGSQYRTSPSCFLSGSICFCGSSSQQMPMSMCSSGVGSGGEKK